MEQFGCSLANQRRKYMKLEQFMRSIYLGDRACKTVVILPPYFRTRAIRNVAPARCEPDAVGQRDAAGTPWVISSSMPSADAPH